MTGTGSACGDVFAQAPNAGACRTSACCKNEEVVDTRSVVACTECHVHWNLDLEVAKCTDPDHTHQRFEVHRHRSVVVLPDGTEVTAVSFDAADPYVREQTTGLRALS
jgi:hypothetical protein